MEITFRDQALAHIGATRRLYYRGPKHHGMATIFGPTAERSENEEALAEHRRHGLPLDAKLREIEAALGRRRPAQAATPSARNPAPPPAVRAPAPAVAPVPPAAPTASSAAPAASPSLDQLARKVYSTTVETQWGRSYTRVEPELGAETPPWQSAARVVEEPVTLSAEAAAFERRLDPDAVYAKWNAKMNPGKPKPAESAREE